MQNPFKALKLRIYKEPHTRWWLIRVPIVIIMAYIFLKEVTIENYESFFWAVNWGIHELGHAIFFITQHEFLIFAGGTLIQIIAPLSMSAYFWSQKDYFASGWAVSWLGINLFNISDYIGSTGDPVYNLLSPFSSNPEHDWNYMLNKLGIWQHYEQISNIVGFIAYLTMLTGLIWMSWCIIIFFKLKYAKKCEYVK